MNPLNMLHDHNQVQSDNIIYEYKVGVSVWEKIKYKYKSRVVSICEQTKTIFVELEVHPDLQFKGATYQLTKGRKIKEKSFTMDDMTGVVQGKTNHKTKLSKNAIFGTDVTNVVQGSHGPQLQVSTLGMKHKMYLRVQFSLERTVLYKITRKPVNIRRKKNVLPHVGDHQNSAAYATHIPVMNGSQHYAGHSGAFDTRSVGPIVPMNGPVYIRSVDPLHSATSSVEPVLQRNTSSTMNLADCPVPEIAQKHAHLHGTRPDSVCDHLNGSTTIHSHDPHAAHSGHVDQQGSFVAPLMTGQSDTVVQPHHKVHSDKDHVHHKEHDSAHAARPVEHLLGREQIEGYHNNPAFEPAVDSNVSTAEHAIPVPPALPAQPL